MEAFEQTLGGSLGEILFVVIGHLHRHRQDCQKLQVWLGSVVAKLAKHFDERLEPNSSPNALKGSQLYTTKGGSKWRLDEYYRLPCNLESLEVVQETVACWHGL